MSDITQARLDEVLAYYVNGNDKETARNYIKSWGPKIPGYDVAAELSKIDNPAGSGEPTNPAEQPATTPETAVTPETKPEEEVETENNASQTPV